MAKTYAELFAEVRERVRTISLEALKARLDAGTPTTLVDVREQHEFNAGYIPGAIHIPRGFLEIQAESKLPGTAFLDVVVEPQSARTDLSLRTEFHPDGLAGHAFWWAELPAHKVVFELMTRRLASLVLAG